MTEPPAGDRPGRPEHGDPPRRWTLPGELLAEVSGGPVRRSVRDWAVDVLLFGWALMWWALIGFVDTSGPADPAFPPDWVRAVDVPLGLLSCLALWLRRRYPMGLAIAFLPVSAVADTIFGSLMVVLLNLALRVPWRPALVMLGLYLLAAVPYMVLHALPQEGPLVVGFVVAYYLAFFAWGVAIRARRQEVLRLREDAARARADHARRLAETRRREREAIAREMHDVLAHRISLLSVHAGALAYRLRRTAEEDAPPPAPAEIAASAQTIRDTAHQALEELREVLTVLRGGPAAATAGMAPAGPGHAPPPAPVTPLPTIAEVAGLVAEAEAAGQRVRFLDSTDAEAAQALRSPVQRTVYRVVQEGLTNARKHAPGQPVTVELGGAPGRGLTIVLRNPLGSGASPGPEPVIPGTGSGLTGLSERTALEGGTLEHGCADGTFHLTAHLPWPG